MKNELEKQITIEAASQNFSLTKGDLYEIAKNVCNTFGENADCFKIGDAVSYYYNV